MAEPHVEILLVEDNPNDVELTLHTFRRNRLANPVHVCRDGQEALDFLFGPAAPASAPKIILLDLKLPKVDGIEVLRKVKGDQRTKRIPVVVLTASREEKDMVEAYDLGVNSYIVKPVDFNQFAEAMRTLGLYWLVLNRPPT